jgi:hypothetical protein
MAVVRPRPDHLGMHERGLYEIQRGLYEIQDDLRGTWLEDWAGAGVDEIETYLAKHAAFLSYLESQEAA